MRIHIRLFVALLLLLCAVLLLCACDPTGMVDGIKSEVSSRIDEVSSKVDDIKNEVSNKVSELLTTTVPPITTLPPDAPPSPGMQYQKSTDGNSYVVRGYAGSEKDLVIASEYQGLPVSAIMQGAFKNKASLSSIRIPAAITSIGKGAFSGCTGLISAEGGAHYADRWAVGVGEFAGNVTLRANTVGIADGAFEGRTNLLSLAIGAELTVIGADAFLGCSSLIGITVAEDNPAFTATADALYNKEMTRLIRYFGSGESFVLPASVVEIAPSAFRDQPALREITLEAGSALALIGEYAFAGCTALVGFDLPVAIARIPNGMFAGCTSLSDFALPEGSACTAIGAEAFRGCISLASFTIPEGVVEIGQNAFFECSGLLGVRFAVTSGWMVGGQDLVASQIATPAQSAAALTRTYRVKTWVRKTR